MKTLSYICLLILAYFGIGIKVKSKGYEGFLLKVYVEKDYTEHFVLVKLGKRKVFGIKLWRKRSVYNVLNFTFK